MKRQAVLLVPALVLASALSLAGCSGGSEEATFDQRPPAGSGKNGQSPQPTASGYPTN
ncbi:hypothetical protein [Streptomyces sp. NPDC058701]|uniref:hypothetical protein n=1 Tax=Streptomyces sp. NPDC058701 TaxID=3346608 RepID=UPI00365A9DD4